MGGVEEDMKISMQFKVRWEKGKESLPDFKKKYQAFKHHVTGLQLKGHIPTAEIYWVVERHESSQLLLPPAPPTIVRDDFPEISGPALLVDKRLL